MEQETIEKEQQKINKMREIIDAHANMGLDTSNLRKNLFPVGQGFRELLKKMDNYNISKSIIVPFPSPAGQFNENTPWYDIENHQLINASHYSRRLIPFPAVNPNDKRSVENINVVRMFSDGIKGIKLSHTIPMNFSIDKLINHPLMKIVQDNNLVFMIHIGTGKEQGANRVHGTLDYAIKVAKYYPKIKFIFCHLGRLHETIIEALNLENVFMDTAGLALWNKWTQFIALKPLGLFKNSTPISVIEQLIKLGYEDKLLFGSDEPYTSYETEITNIEKASISEKAKNKIFYENIAKLLNLK